MKRLAAVLALVLAATAGAQEPGLRMTASKPRGHIALSLTGPPAAQVDVREGTREVGLVTLDAAGAGSVPDAGTWSCRRRRRTFTATGAALEATATTTTPGCAHRYAITVRPRRPRAGRRVRIAVRDRFGLTRRPRICVDRHCRAGRLRTRLPAGRYRIHADGRVVRPLRVRPPRHVRVLATGDSTIQIIDGFLKQRLPRDRVHTEAKISSGLSKPAFFDWPAHAREQVRAFHPDVTIMSIGPNDGYPFGSVPCCGTPWRRRYARVVVRMSHTYGRVFWCLQPAPRPAEYHRILAAVNAALRRAARRDHGVELIDLSKTFTPGFHFRQYVHGSSVRADDGIHFNVAGASLATDVIIRRLRHAGAL